MDDARIWGSEDGLWTASPERYHEIISDDCLMVLPEPPFVFDGVAAADEVSRTPRWTKVDFADQRVSRPQEGLIVIAYRVTAGREGSQSYSARCTTTYRRLAEDEWRVIPHHQTPVAGR